jgi:FtsP/CotA-like multicopper oxidase with cupredoxin domain
VLTTSGKGRVMQALILMLLVALTLAGGQVSAEERKFILVNDALNGTKLWYPPSLTVHQGDTVVLTLINKLEEPHGFNLEDFGIKEVVAPKAQTTVGFSAATTGVHDFGCHMHPPHLGGQLLVLPAH